MADTLNKLKMVNQHVKIYFALNEEYLVDTENEALWRDTLKQLSLATSSTKESLNEINLVKNAPHCSLLQQKIITRANGHIQKVLRIVDSIFLINENVSLHKQKNNRLEKLKSKRTRVRDQIEAEKERKESLLLHHENADFFYALDETVRKHAQALAAAMSDFVQDHALASKLLRATHTDHLFNFMRRTKEEIIIYDQTNELVTGKSSQEVIWAL